jgi:bacteriocin-like protein
MKKKIKKVSKKELKKVKGGVKRDKLDTSKLAGFDGMIAPAFKNIVSKD